MNLIHLFALMYKLYNEYDFITFNYQSATSMIRFFTNLRQVGFYFLFLRIKSTISKIFLSIDVLTSLLHKDAQTERNIKTIGAH